MKVNKAFLVAASATTILVLACTGCSSTGWHAPEATIPPAKLISVQGMDPRFTSQVIPLLQSRGYTVLSTNSPDAIICRSYCGGGFGMSAEISLWKDGKMLAKGKGSNAGWGNWLARDSATEDIIARAARALDEQLVTMENLGSIKSSSH